MILVFNCNLAYALPPGKYEKPPRVRFMLEHQRLRILPWGHSPEKMADPRRRVVVDANTSNLQGFICQWLPRRRWLDWLLPRLHRWEIHEAEDESLLFTMQEWKGLVPFLRRVFWQVSDAEDHAVGTVGRQAPKHRRS